jgi:hypothetical protein
MEKLKHNPSSLGVGLLKLWVFVKTHGSNNCDENWRFYFMKFKFNKEARASFASEIKKVSTYGLAALGLLGYSSKSGWVLFAAGGWWLVFQALAHVLLSIEDE